MPAVSDTWIIIKIGNKEYAVNSQYTKAITELKNDGLIAESSGAFIRGIYNIFNTDIQVIDGFKMSKQTSMNDNKIEFSRKITEIKIQYMAWLDSIEWQTMSPDLEEAETSLTLETRLFAWINDSSLPHNEYLDRISSRLKDHMIININRGKKLVRSRSLGGEDDLKSTQLEMTEIRNQANRHILDALDNIIVWYNSKMSEMCILVSANGKNFGISIDAVELVVDNCDRMSRTKRTTISAGIVEINGKQYNIIDLTKLSKVIH